jgi:hypothetical protein
MTMARAKMAEDGPEQRRPNTRLTLRPRLDRVNASGATKRVATSTTVVAARWPPSSHRKAANKASIRAVAAELRQRGLPLKPRVPRRGAAGRAQEPE